MPNLTLEGRSKYFDERSSRFFAPQTDSEPARSANPVAEISNSDDDIKAISDSEQPSKQKTLKEKGHQQTRITRAQTRNNPTDSEQEERHLGPRGGLVRRWKQPGDATLIPDPMTPKSIYFGGGLRPMNTLNSPQPQSTRNRFAQQYTTKGLYDNYDKQADHLLNANAAHAAKRPAPNKSAPRGSHLPPSKKPRTGASPMQGRSRHDAISLDDSQDSIAVRDDPIDFSPERAVQSTQTRRQSAQKSKPQVSQAGVQHSAAHRADGDGAADLINKDELEVLGTPATLRPNSSQSVERPVDDLDADDDAGEHFTKNAARQRKAQQGSSSPEPVTRQKVRQSGKLQINPPFKSHKSASSYIREGLDRAREAPKPSGRDRNSSHSPDELQSGPTTSYARPLTNNSSRNQQTSMTNRSASSIASSIVGNVNSTKISRSRKTRMNGSPPPVGSFDLQNVRYAGLYEFSKEILQHLRFVVEPAEKSFYLAYKNSALSDTEDDEAVSVAHLVKAINCVKWSENGSIIILYLPNSENKPSGPMALDLPTQGQAVALIRALQAIDETLNVKVESHRRMVNIFETVGVEADMRAGSFASRQLAIKESMQSPTVNGTSQKSSRLVDLLDKPPSRRPQQQTVISGRERQAALDDLGDYAQTHSQAPTQEPKQADSKSSTSFSPYFDQAQTRTRTLRSTPRKVKSPSPPPKPKFSQTEAMGKAWKNALVYPQGGKRRESVGFDELWRLDDDEFLNDTLIGFFIRYIQDQTEQTRLQDLKKMHFFNSYFFDSLSKGTKSAKTINFDSVKRWTAKIDIFNRDFVIVPVNENVHWFVAIICNLKNLRPKKDDDEADDEVEELAPTVTIGDGDDTVEQGRRTKETRESFEELNLEDADPPTSSTLTESKIQDAPTPKKPGRGRKKKSRYSLPKYDTSQPIIITLDSLGLARGTVAATLKQYIVHEARDKKNWEISDQAIKAMTAKNIPTQSNYSDCGLYMCMYLEQFMCDPYGFVQKILLREEKEIRWPLKIHSEDLRTNMRDWILELYRRQENETSVMDIQDMGKILVQMREPSPEPELVEESPEPEPPPLPTRSRAHTPMQRQSEHNIPGLDYQDDDDDGFQDEANPAPVSSNTQKQLAAKAIQQINDSADVVLIEDDASPVKSKKDVKSSSGTSKHHDPAELAKWMRQKRSPSAKKAKEGSPSKEQQGARSTSVSTEFMEGLQGFAQDFDDEQAKIERLRNAAKNPAPDSELAEEIAETQPEADDGESQESWIPALGAEKKEPRQESEEMLV